MVEMLALAAVVVDLLPPKRSVLEEVETEV